MINNDIANHLNRYFNRGAQSEAGNTAQEMYKKIKARHEAIQGKNQSAANAEDTQAANKKGATDSANVGNFGKGYIRNRTKTADANKTKTTPDAAAQDDANSKLTAEERRQKELQAILDKLNAEEAARYPSRQKKESTKTDASAETEVVTSQNPEDAKANGFESFLNDMPLFNEFKTGLKDAFKRLDSATAGSISAQYELNYSSMQYIADAAGNYEYKETSFSIKLDLNYIKAAGGSGKTGKEIADLIDSSEDFESLVNNLKTIGQTPAATGAPKTSSPDDIMAGLQDYFSPEKTADRILDFSTAFFPKSAAFQKYGDTEEGREEFAKLMRDAIQKGFDQAMGKLGTVPKATQDGIDKTHDLVFSGIDDFVKNGMNRNKQQQGVYDSLEQFAMSFEMNYSQKTVSVRNHNQGVTYGAQGQTQETQPTQSALDTQA